MHLGPPVDEPSLYIRGRANLRVKLQALLSRLLAHRLASGTFVAHRSSLLYGWVRRGGGEDQHAHTERRACGRSTAGGGPSPCTPGAELLAAQAEVSTRRCRDRRAAGRRPPAPAHDEGRALLGA